LVRDGATTQIFSINPDNLKQKPVVYCYYLLNDMLLLCSRKKGVLGGKTGKMVCDHFFKLVEIALIDMKDSGIGFN
jgi:hypothetical protein